MASVKSTKSPKVSKTDTATMVKKAFFLPESQFRALKIYAATNDVGISETLQKILAKAGFK